MMGGAKAHYDCIKAFSETDFNEDLQSITVPMLIMHGDDDQIVPIADSALLSAKLVKNGTLKVYPGPAARHVHNAPGRDQQGSAELHQRMTNEPGLATQSYPGATDELRVHRVREALVTQRASHVFALQPPRVRGHGHAEQPRLRRVHGDARHVGAPPPVPDLRPRRLLRRLEKQACDEALPFDAASHHHVARARRRLELGAMWMKSRWEID
jgi:hypothetical protein